MNAKTSPAYSQSVANPTAAVASEFRRVGFRIESLKPPKGLRIGIVRSLFRSTLTERMQAVVEKRAATFNATIGRTLLARGALETPLLAARLLADSKIDGVVVLAAVVKGETAHDEVVVRTATSALVGQSLQQGKPVGIGIIGPGVTLEQAHARVEEYAQGALDAVVLTAAQMKKSAKK